STKRRQDERAAQRNPGPTGPGQESYLFIRGKELGHPLYRSGESPSLQEEVLQRKMLFYPADASSILPAKRILFFSRCMGN
ncbi:MAG: hypothetical protein V4487_06685, partial [Chlamydiota bacterium]